MSRNSTLTDLPSSAASPLLAVGTAVLTAAVSGVVWWSANSEFVQRRLLSPQSLTKRRSYQHTAAWEKLLRDGLKDGLKSGTASSVSSQEPVIVVEGKHACKDFLANEFNQKKTNESIVSIVGIGRDHGEASEYEYYVWLRKEATDQVYRMLLKEFGLLLTDAMEEQVTTTAMAFCADASSGLGSDILATILEEQQETLGVPVVREPLWMAQFAQLIESKAMLQQDTIVKILFGLVRLEAFRIRHKVGKTKTVLFTLGQAIMPTLAPLLQTTFPCERHVFIYDGCVSSVARAEAKRDAFLRERPTSNSPSWKLRYQSMIHTTPMSSTMTSSISTLPACLLDLPARTASATETWMAAVDAFFRLKADEDSNEYLPFVCKLANVVALGTPDSRRLALVNLVQFVTGSRSRPLPDEVVYEAQKSMMGVGMRQIQLQPFTAELYRQIECCVFCHKSILIGDKTLIDTVVPAKEWTLKAAKKISGCSCCAPEEDDEEEEEMNVDAEMSRPEEDVMGINNSGNVSVSTTKGSNGQNGRTYNNNSSSSGDGVGGLVTDMEKPKIKKKGLDMSQPGAFAMAFNTNRAS